MPTTVAAFPVPSRRETDTPCRIDIVFPVLPPAFDGIGDHTAHLASALSAEGAQVRILTAQSDWTPQDGIEVETAFSLNPLTGLQGLQRAVASAPPDLLFVQFNQFSYGRYGFNPGLPWTLHTIRRAHPSVRIVLMAHEEFVPLTSLANAVMTTWQRAQFWALGRAAHAIGFSTSSWIDKFRPWFSDTPLYHLPVGSNIPQCRLTREDARRQLGLEESFVIGYFGSVESGRHVDHLTRSLHRLHTVSEGRAVLLYVGADGAALQSALGDEVPFYDAGRLPAPEVSAHFAAMDLYLAPFVEGVSTRRGSFMTSLQHGVPTLATAGPQTDPLLREHQGRALVLTAEYDVEAFADAAVDVFFRSAPDRYALGKAGQQLYRSSFDWPVLARVVTSLAHAPRSPHSDAVPPLL